MLTEEQLANIEQIRNARVYTINPQDIKYCQQAEFIIWDYQNAILDGDWDKPLFPFETSYAARLLRSLHQIEKGASWEETEYWASVLVDIAGRWKGSRRNLMWLHDRCYKFYNRLVAETKLANAIPEQYSLRDHIGVNIARDGQLIFENGRNRLCIAKFLNIPKIQISIVVRHAEWQRFKDKVINYANTHKGVVYAPLSHIDLSDIPSLHKGRIELIADHILPSAKTVLDIGAHWGYHCIYLSKLGYNCLAVEYRSSYMVFLETLRIAAQTSFELFNGSIFDLKETSFDVVLALRIFHHFCRSDEKFQSMRKFLSNLNAKQMFFQLDNSHVYWTTKYGINSVADFVGFILANSKFKHCEQIGSFDGGPIYKFW